MNKNNTTNCAHKRVNEMSTKTAFIGNQQLNANMQLYSLYTVLFIILNSSGVHSTDNYFTTNAQGFHSVPTTVKTYENDTVLLPCYASSKCRWSSYLHVQHAIKE